MDRAKLYASACTVAVALEWTGNNDEALLAMLGANPLHFTIDKDADGCIYFYDSMAARGVSASPGDMIVIVPGSGILVLTRFDFEMLFSGELPAMLRLGRGA